MLLVLSNEIKKDAEMLLKLCQRIVADSTGNAYNTRAFSSCVSLIIFFNTKNLYVINTYFVVGESFVICNNRFI